MGSDKLADVTPLSSVRFQKEIQLLYFFLQNGRRDIDPPILLLHSYTRYRLFHWLHFSQLTPQTAIFSFHNIDNGTFLIQNCILLLLELHIYNARKCGFLSFNNFLNEISKIKNLKRKVAVNNRNKCERFRKKWHRTNVPYYLIGNKKN